MRVGKIRNKVRQIYALFASKKRDKRVWKYVISTLDEIGLSYGKYEKEACIRYTIQMEFEGEEGSVVNRISLEDQFVEFSCCIIDSFPEHLTAECMVLAGHINNMLGNIKVKVYPQTNSVFLNYKVALSFFDLYPDKIKVAWQKHFNVSNDCYWAFNKIMKTGEDPVFIISELLNRNRS